MKKKQVEKEQNNEKQLPRQETTLGEDIFQLLLKIVLIILAVILFVAKRENIFLFSVLFLQKTSAIL